MASENDKPPVPSGPMFVCIRRGRGRPRRKCVICQTQEHEVLCDGKGCNKPMCKGCAHHVEPDQDYCPECWKTESVKPKQEDLF